MIPHDLISLAAAHVSVQTVTDPKTKKTEKVNVVSKEEVVLSEVHAQQFDELCTKLEKKPTVTRLSKRGAIQLPAETLVSILSEATKKGIQLDDPE